MIARRNPWNRASKRDSIFRGYWRDDDFLTKMLPISKAAQALLRRVFVLDPEERITIPEFRQAILAIDTFFLSDSELSLAAKSAKDVAEDNERHSADISRTAPPPKPATKVEPPMVQATISDEVYLYAPPNPAEIVLISENGKTRFTIGSDVSEDISSASASSSASTASDSTAPLTPEATMNKIPSEVDITDAVTKKQSDGRDLEERVHIIITSC